MHTAQQNSYTMYTQKNSTKLNLAQCAEKLIHTVQENSYIQSARICKHNVQENSHTLHIQTHIQCAGIMTQSTGKSGVHKN